MKLHESNSCIVVKLQVNSWLAFVEIREKAWEYLNDLRNACYIVDEVIGYVKATKQEVHNSSEMCD